MEAPRLHSRGSSIPGISPFRRKAFPRMLGFAKRSRGGREIGFANFTVHSAPFTPAFTGGVPWRDVMEECCTRVIGKDEEHGQSPSLSTLERREEPTPGASLPASLTPPSS